MRLRYVLCHHAGRDNVVLEIAILTGLWDAPENPEELRSKILFGLQADATGSIARHEGLDLYVDEPRPSDIAAQDVCVGRVAERDDRRVPPPAQLPGDEKLTRITSGAFFFGHQ